MRMLHTMLRVRDLDAAVQFWCDALGLVEVRRTPYASGRYTLAFLSAPADPEGHQLELTWNWDQTERYTVGRNFGHVAVGVDDVYAACARLQEHGVTILRPPRDGRMAFVRSPDDQSVELLQIGASRPPAEPWSSMPNTGSW